MNKEHFLKVMPQDQIEKAIEMWNGGYEGDNVVEAFYEALEDEDELQNIIDYFLPHSVDDVVEEVREQLRKATEGLRGSKYENNQTVVVIPLSEELKPYVFLDAERFALDIYGFRVSKTFKWGVGQAFGDYGFADEEEGYLAVAVYTARNY